jgi:hypothetical protein
MSSPFFTLNKVAYTIYKVAVPFYTQTVMKATGVKTLADIPPIRPRTSPISFTLRADSGRCSDREGHVPSRFKKVEPKEGPLPIR